MTSQANLDEVHPVSGAIEANLAADANLPFNKPAY